MKLVWFGFFIEILILSLIKSFIIDFEAVAIIVVILHILFTMIVLISYKNKSKFIFLGAYFSRVAFMFWDLYARNIFVLPNSGSDTEMFYNQALSFSKSLSLLINETGGLYSKINGFLFHMIGPQRMIGQYINVLLGLSIIFILYKILVLLEVNTKVRTIIILLGAFFPNSMVMSSIFLREIIPTFFVTVSLYYFVKWFKKAGYLNMILTFMMLGIASAFHSGVIGIIIGYIFMFLFYERDTKRFRFTNRTIVSFIMIVIVFYLGYTSYGDEIFYKFGEVNDIGDIYRTANVSRGGSSYLGNLEINNLIQLIIYGPIKGLFFLTSPLPMDWRGLRDIFTFFTDSLLYMSIIIYFFKNRKNFGSRRTLIISFIIMIIGSTLIFSIGVSNAGTAVRHRQKLISVFLILFGIMIDGKHKAKKVIYKN